MWIKIKYGNNFDLIIMPGVAFDIKGNRIGYGGGYYDKYFSHINGESNKIVLAYDFQIVNSIENKAHDIKVNCIITNNEFIKINENSKNIKSLEKIFHMCIIKIIN